VTWTFDLLILKVVSESRVTWATSVPILVFLGLSVLDLVPRSRSPGCFAHAVFARQVAAAVGVGTFCPWETAATLPSARRRKALRHPRRVEWGGGISWRPPAYSMLSMRGLVYSLSEIYLVFQKHLFFEQAVSVATQYASAPAS